MHDLRHWARVTLPVVALVIASLIAGSNAALAYGAADRPLAQLEFSGNCNNPSFPLCFQPPSGFGLGGIWLWVEVDANHTGDVAGAGCGHIRGVGGGASSIRGDVTWTLSTVPLGFPVGVDPHSLYYNVRLPDGETISWPHTVGHYSLHPAPGVALEATTAP